ncbi:MAG: NADH-quinone oxidoreductase subunit NuoH [Dehalococcoidia bacterium]
MSPFLENTLFRNIYCNISSGSNDCTNLGYSGGILPAGYEWLVFAITGFIMAMTVINGVLLGVLAFIWGERRLLARFQNRVGPNRWGPFGTFTSVADAIKTMFKEDVVPKDADRWLFNLAPILMVVPIFLVFAVIPFGAGTVIADLNIGILFVIAVTSMSGLAVVMASWASGNRIAIFSGLRAVAMLISYEIPMALALLGVLMLSGSLALGSIVGAQDVPFILVQPLGFLVFFLAALAETNRTPFDITEAESELAAGYLNDYSSMKFGVFFLAEFAAAIAAAAVMVTVFLSGWRGWGFFPSEVWFFLKLALVLSAIVWVRATWPRLRIDQILTLAWKGLFELTLINLVATAVLVAIWPSPTAGQLWIMAGVNWVVFFISILLIGRLLSPRPHMDESAQDTSIALYPVATEEDQARPVAVEGAD